MRVPVRLTFAFLAASIFTQASSAYAQDSHYWTQQYGARAELLGGIAVGSHLDVSSTYYNPGALVLVSSKEYLQSALPFQIQHLTVEDGAGAGEKLSKLDLRSAPSLLAGLLPFQLWGGRMAYSSLTRHEFKISLKNRVGVPDTLPDDRLVFAGENTFRHEVAELWAGITWSRRFGKRTGVGLTQYFTYRGQNSRTQTFAQTAVGGTGSSLTIVDDFDYWTLGLVWKLGVAFDYAPLSFGLAFTTPDVDYYGTGSALFNRAVTDNTGNSVIVARLEKGLKPTHHSPPSIAAGAAYRLRNSAIHLSAEWFAPVSRYTAMDAGVDDVIGGITLSRRLTEELDSVVNGGIGLEYTFNDRIKYFGSFRTDFSANVPRSNANLSITRWNLYHVSSGGTFRFNSVDVTLGLTYSFGGDDVSTRVDFEGSDGGVEIEGPGSMHVSYQNFRVLFGFSFKTL